MEIAFAIAKARGYDLPCECGVWGRFQVTASDRSRLNGAQGGAELSRQLIDRFCVADLLTFPSYASKLKIRMRCEKVMS
jgi:hypothetical protein